MGIYCKKSSGITLVALAITVVILLILAGISISVLTGNNGLLKKTGSAKEKHDIASIKEEVEAILYQSYDSRAVLDYNILKTKLNSIAGVSNVPEQIQSLPITIKVNGYDVTIDAQKNVIVESNVE